MPVFRVEKNKNYTVMSNYHLRDAGLSLKAKGLLSFMLSLTETWDYSISGLSAVCKEGKDAIRSTLQELEEARYIVRYQIHKADGSFGGNEYVIYEQPQETTAPDSPLSGNPSSGNPTQINTNRISKDLNKPPIAPQGGAACQQQASSDSQAPAPAKTPRRKRRPKSVPTWQPARFEGFWLAYPRDEDRAKAVEVWDKLPQDEELMARHNGDETALLDEIAAGLKRHLTCEDWQNNIGIPYAFRWLRDRKWTEKAKAPPAPRASPADSGQVEGRGLPIWT